MLARYPDRAGAPATPAGQFAVLQGCRAAIRTQGLLTQRTVRFDGRSSASSPTSKLPRHDLYVTVGVDASDVVRALGCSDMGSHLIFGDARDARDVQPWPGARCGRSATHLQQEDGAARSDRAWRCVRRRRWRRSAGCPAASRTTSTTCSPSSSAISTSRCAASATDDAAHRSGSLNAARQASERAATLVQRLLAFSRQHPQEVKSVDINRLVQGMSELLRRTIGETITIETVLAGGLWKVAIDPNQLENAILNLAVNARDAMPDGGRLTIETANSYLDEPMSRPTAATSAAGNMCCSRSATPAPA